MYEILLSVFRMIRPISLICQAEWYAKDPFHMVVKMIELPPYGHTFRIRVKSSRFQDFKISRFQDFKISRFGSSSIWTYLQNSILAVCS